MLLGALQHELGPLRSKITPPPLSLTFYFSLFLILGPSKKKQWANSDEFQFLVGDTLSPRESSPLGKILATPLNQTMFIV